MTVLYRCDLQQRDTYVWFEICSNVQVFGGGGGFSEVHCSPIRVYISRPIKHNLIFKGNLQQKTKYVLLS